MGPTRKRLPGRNDESVIVLGSASLATMGALLLIGAGLGRVPDGIDCSVIETI